MKERKHKRAHANIFECVSVRVFELCLCIHIFVYACVCVFEILNRKRFFVYKTGGFCYFFFWFVSNLFYFHCVFIFMIHEQIQDSAVSYSNIAYLVTLFLFQQLSFVIP